MENTALATATLHGMTLRQALSQCTSTAERLELLPRFVDLCAAVGKAHEQGLVCRSIHPDIILLGDHGEIVLTDWSLQKARGREDHLSARVTACVEALRRGEDSPLHAAYVAPEIVLGRLEDVDARTDVYALGAILYAMLTGHDPFEGDTPEILESATTGHPKPVAQVDPQAPPELVAVCRRAMHREPSARYLNASELAREIRRPSEALPTPDALPDAVRAEGNWRALFVGACVLAVVALAGAVLSNQRASARLEQMAGDIRELQDGHAALENERDTATRRIEDLEQARESAEAELDRTHTALTQAQNALAAARETPAPKPSPAIAPTAAPAAIAPAPTAPDPGAAPPAATDAQTPPSTPKPTEMPGPAARVPRGVREELSPPAGPLPADAPAKPNARKQEVLAAIDSLVTGLEETTATDGTKGLALQASDEVETLGFQDGDIVTQINRASVASVDDVKAALKHIDKEPGFSVRVLRGGQASWIRVSYSEEQPKPAPTPPAPAQSAPPTESAPAPEEIPSGADDAIPGAESPGEEGDSPQ